MSFLHYAQSPVESDEEIEIDKEIETQQNYRADLDTEELNELDKNIVAGSAK
jgi:hypothetical protein